MRSLFALALVTLAACNEGEELTPGSGSPEGAAAYQRYCALCHGPNGEGHLADNAPMLRNQELLQSASDAYLRRAIAEGRPGTPMSAWSRRAGGPLDETSIDQILEHLRSWQTEPRVAVDLDTRPRGNTAPGLNLYGAQCARCHGPLGHGGTAPQLANSVFLASASDGFLRHAIVHGRSETEMPAFERRLDPGQVDDVIAFVRTFTSAPPPPPPEEEPALPAIADLEIAIHPEGRPARFELRDGRLVSGVAVHEALERGERIIILDARATSDWLRGRIPGAIPVPFYELDTIVPSLPRDETWIIAYCACPHAASGRVVDSLREHGFARTAILDEGIGWWEQQEGYPMAHGPTPP